MEPPELELRKVRRRRGALLKIFQRQQSMRIVYSKPCDLLPSPCVLWLALRSKRRETATAPQDRRGKGSETGDRSGRSRDKQDADVVDAPGLVVEGVVQPVRLE